MNPKIVIGVLIGLVIGLVLGIFVSIFFDFPSFFHTAAGRYNQVQVSGTVSETLIGTIKFSSLDEEIETSVPIVNSTYSILLVGGKSYTVRVHSAGPIAIFTGSLYVPLGVSIFTANF